MDGRGRRINVERDQQICLAVMTNIKRGIRASVTAKGFGIRGDATVFQILKRGGLLEAYREQVRNYQRKR